MKNIRIRTTPGDDKNIKFHLEQDFDLLEILSLKLTQEDVYRRFYADYGVVVGRVLMNNGVGVPNARVSIFIPVDENENDELKRVYPYTSIVDSNDDGFRYNLLPSNNKGDCHVGTGSFPSKREILDNDINLNIFEKYYKYSATTNDAGDFMIFGVPVGTHQINIDVDISDIGIFSQKPFDLIDKGASDKMFTSVNQFKKSNNLNSLPQIKNQKTGVNVIPFWGDRQENEIGITRVDFDINYEITPKAIFMGGTFGDTDKNSINKNCQTRKQAGKVCETVPGDGRITMIRKTNTNEVEEFLIDGGDVIDDDGTWAYMVPMNMDYMVTDEFGELIPSEDPTKGIPTRTRARFRLESQISGGEGRLRTKADYLIPHNPKNKDEIDYEFGENTKETSFRDLYWNQIYSVKNFIPRFQNNGRLQSRKFTGFKDVDDCTGSKNPIPFNRMDSDLNPLFIIICTLLSVFVDLMSLINGVISVKLPFGRICDIVRGIRCIRVRCNEMYFAPNCAGTCYDSKGSSDRKNDGPGSDDEDELIDCYQGQLAQALNVYEFDFYNDWINGSLYTVLVKYKQRNSDSKFCDVDDGEGYLHDTLINDTFEGHTEIKINEGVIKEYNDELFYAPVTKNGIYKLFATDIISLGTINDFDWRGLPNIQNLLEPTSYLVPPLIGNVDDELNDYTPIIDYGEVHGLLFDLNCRGVSVSNRQARNIKRVCELGVGIDEDRFDEPGGTGKDGEITNGDIENQLVRDRLILLNSESVNSLPDNGLSSGFGGSDYMNYIGLNNKQIPQTNNSFYFYFGTEPNKTALHKMRKKYFVACKAKANLKYGEG